MANSLLNEYKKHLKPLRDFAKKYTFGIRVSLVSQFLTVVVLTIGVIWSYTGWFTAMLIAIFGTGSTVGMIISILSIYVFLFVGWMLFIPVRYYCKKLEGKENDS